MGSMTNAGGASAGRYRKSSAPAGKRLAAHNNMSAMKGIAALRANAKAEEGAEMSKPKKKGIARKVPRSKRTQNLKSAADGVLD